MKCSVTLKNWGDITILFFSILNCIRLLYFVYWLKLLNFVQNYSLPYESEKELFSWLVRPCNKNGFFTKLTFAENGPFMVVPVSYYYCKHYH